MALWGRFWGVRAVAALALSAVLVGSGPQSVPAVAETPLPVPGPVTVSSRDTVAVASWDGDAARYLVETATTPDFAAPASNEVASELTVLSALQPATTYYLRVSALGPDRTRSTASPTVTFTTAEARYPWPGPVLTVESLGSTSLDPNWTAPGKDLSYEVQLAGDEAFTTPQSKTVEATSASFVGLETGTAYSLRVRVVDATGSPQSGWSAPVTREPAASLPLRIGSFNIKKASQAKWSQRRTAVAATIRGEDPDVVGLQEATPQHVAGGRRQYTDVVALLGSEWALTDSSSGATGEVRTIYNSSRVSLVDHGHVALSGSTRFGVVRYATWALFEQKSTGKRFIFVNTHLVWQKSAKAKAWRTGATRQLVAMVRRVNPNGVPVIIGGDFNSAGYRTSGNGVYRTITGAGYLDPLVRTGKLGAAEELVRSDLKTVTKMSRRAPRDRWAPMVDHLFVSRMRVEEWETVARLDRSGRYIGTIPSDHNMIRVTVYLP